MKPFFGIKVLIGGFMLSPFLLVMIYFLIRPQPMEIQLDAAHFNTAVELHDWGLLEMAIAEYDVVTDINPSYLEAYQRRGDAYFAKGDLGRAVVDYNAAISLRSLLISGLGSQKRTVLIRSVSEAYMGKALAYAWQGRDLEAQKITTYAVDFGYDPVVAKANIEGMVERRENQGSLNP